MFKVIFCDVKKLSAEIGLYAIICIFDFENLDRYMKNKS